MDQNLSDAAWWTAHIVSPVAFIGTLLGFLPGATAVIIFLFYSVQLYESKSVQKWIANRRERRLQKLRMKIQCLEQTVHEHDRRHK